MSAPRRPQVSARSRVWRISSGRSAAPTTAWSREVGARGQERGAFGRRLRHVEAERRVHLRQKQGAQVVKAADRRARVSMRAATSGGGRICAGHARDEVAARGMAGEANGAGDLGCRFAVDGHAPIARGDRRDADIGGLWVARQRHGPAAAARPDGEVGKGGFVHPLPVAAMDEDDEAPGLPRRAGRGRSAPAGGCRMAGRDAPCPAPPWPRAMWRPSVGPEPERVAARHVGGIVEGVRPVDETAPSSA
jgi:hypothetical protein